MPGRSTGLGEAGCEEIRTGEFLCLDRAWKDGDRVEADFPFAIRTERMEDRPEYVAVHYGPHLLVACTEGYARFDGTAQELAASLKPVGKPCHFETLLSTVKQYSCLSAM